MVGLFPNLYRPMASSAPPRTTAYAMQSLGRVQSTMPEIMQSLEPQFERVGVERTGDTAHQATRALASSPGSELWHAVVLSSVSSNQETRHCIRILYILM